MQGLIPIARARRIGAASVFRTLALAGLTLLATVLGGALMGWWVGPQFGVDALFGLPIIAVAILVLARPLLGVFLLAMLIPIESVIVIGNATSRSIGLINIPLDMGEVTIVRVLAPLVLVAWGWQKITSQGTWERIVSANILKPSLLFVAFASASLLWSDTPDIGRILTTAQLLLLSVLILDTVNTRQRLEWIIRFLILGGLIAVSLTVAQGLLNPGLERAGDGVSGNENDTGKILVILLPLSFYLLRGSSSTFWRFLGLAYMTTAPIGVIGTLSRTSMVLMPLGLCIQFWEMLKDGFRSMMLMLLGLTFIGAILVTAVDWERAMERTITITPAMEGGGEVGASRMLHWVGGLLIFQDHPLVGVGYGDFGDKFRTYQHLVPDKYAQRVFVHDRSPHSTFFGILAELGLIGTALWIWLMVIALLNARWSWSRSKEANNRTQYILARAVFYSLVAYGLFSVPNEVHLDKLLWLLLGLTVVLRRLTTIQEEPSSQSPMEDGETNL